MSKLGDLFDDVGKSYFEAENKPVTRVYVDLEYIQDLHFGALLYGVTVDQEMKYIHNKLDNYNNRYDRAVAKYFPALKETDEDLDNLLRTPIVCDRICFLAPWTSVYFNMISILLYLKQHNRRVLEHDAKMFLTINVSDVEYPIELRKHLEETLSKQLEMNVAVQQVERYSEQVSEYLKYDLMFLYDYGQFVNTFPNQFVGEGKFSDIRVVAQPYIDLSLGHKPEDYEFVLKSTEKGMDIYCDFSFLRSNIITDRNKE